MMGNWRLPGLSVQLMVQVIMRKVSGYMTRCESCESMSEVWTWEWGYVGLNLWVSSVGER